MTPRQTKTIKDISICIDVIMTNENEDRIDERLKPLYNTIKQFGVVNFCKLTSQKNFINKKVFNILLKKYDLSI